MCGIVGFVNLKKEHFDTSGMIQKMTRSLAHRGPGDEGCIILPYGSKKDAHIALGHRRLKIIDLSQRAHQPMSNPQGDIFLSYNGEVYNYIELREELSREGYEFTSSSDTEVVLRAYEAWGTECFKKFNGMWGLAILDNRKGKLVLSRGRFGQKPLYYYKTDTELIFASEIKAILLYPSVIKKPNYEKLFRYIAYNYRYLDIDNDSYFENIQQVPKGGFLEFDSCLNMNQGSYWRLKSDNLRYDISDKEAVEGLKDVFFNAVKLRLRSDVPVGCMLSGGMDSTSITAVSYKIFNNPVVTFSGVTGANTKERVYDESKYIDSVIKETNANFHYLRPDPADIFETVDEMLAYHDEPVCTVTWYTLYLLAKKVAKERIPVILNGHGGDELLGGYWIHYHYNFYDLEKQRDYETLDYEKKCWQENHLRDPEEIIQRRDFLHKYRQGETGEMSYFQNYENCFEDNIRLKYSRNLNIVSPFETMLSDRLYAELLFKTVPASLRPEDRNTMSQSLESRSPFLDYKLVEYCFSLPNRCKVRNGLGKWALREAMKGILPEDVRTRKDKSGFVAPADEWFRTINRQQLYDLINSESFKSRGIFNIDNVNKVFKEHLERKENHYMFLWQIINIELWFRRFFDA